MSLSTVQPTSNETPDSTQGGSAVTGATNTGHASTNTNQSRNVNGSQGLSRTCRWFNFTGVSAQIVTLTLKFDWSTNGTASVTTTGAGDSGTAFISFEIDYSINGGAAWTNTVQQTRTASASNGGSDTQNLNTSGSGSINIAANIAINQIQVRDEIHADVSVTENFAVVSTGDINGTVSNIRLEVTFVDGRTIVVM